MTGASCKGDAAGAEQPGFDDAAWRTLDLPHDWAIEGPFDRNTARTPAACPPTAWPGIASTSRFPRPPKAASSSIEFDGAMSNAHVWLNGHELGRPAVRLHRLRLRPDAAPSVRRRPTCWPCASLRKTESSRWYPGAGIYRNVWLDVTGPVHVARWGTYVTTPAVSDAAAPSPSAPSSATAAAKDAKVTLETTILDAAGKEVGRTRSERTVPAGGKRRSKARSTSPAAALGHGPALSLPGRERRSRTAHRCSTAT